MVKIKEAILVEGRYDKNTLSQILDAPILETNGFGIISFISVTPLIAVQALGIIYNIRLKQAEAEVADESFEDLSDFVLSANAEADGTNTEESEECADV